MVIPRGLPLRDYFWRQPFFLAPFLSEKARDWAVPIDSLKLPEDEHKPLFRVDLRVMAVTFCLKVGWLIARTRRPKGIHRGLILHESSGKRGLLAPWDSWRRWAGSL